MCRMRNINMYDYYILHYRHTDGQTDRETDAGQNDLSMFHFTSKATQKLRHSIMKSIKSCSTLWASHSLIFFIQNFSCHTFAWHIASTISDPWVYNTLESKPIKGYKRIWHCTCTLYAVFFSLRRLQYVVFLIIEELFDTSTMPERQSVD